MPSAVPAANRQASWATWVCRCLVITGLMATVGVNLACAPAVGTMTTTTVTNYQVRQNAVTPDPAPRAMGELAPPGKWLVEAGYERTIALTGPSRDAGGGGHSPSVDTGHLRVARAVGTMGEVGLFGQMGLSQKAGAADMAPSGLHSSAWLVGTTLRIRPRISDDVAFVGGLQLAAGAVPWTRDTRLTATTTSEWVPGDDTTKPWSSKNVDKQTFQDDGHAATGTAQASLGFEFRLASQVSLQVGAATGLLSAAKGYFTTTTDCHSTYTYPPGTSSGGCTGKTPDDFPVLHTEAFIMPTAALTATFSPIQLVLGGWWLATSTGGLQDAAPGGLTLAVRAIL